MKEYEELDRKTQSEINMLAGALGLPCLDEYQELSHFIHDVRARIIELRSIINQAAMALNVKINQKG